MNETITVDWNVGNECALKCSYCNVELHDGANLFPSADKFCPAFDHLIDQTRAFSRVNLEFSGGEPSQSSAIQETILKNLDTRIKFKMISNGQASLDWWSEIASHLYNLTLSYHSTTSFDHFYQVVKSVSNFVNPKIFIPISPETWLVQKVAYDRLKALGYDVELQLLYSNFTRGNNEYLKYSAEQWQEYYTEKGVDIANTQQVESTIEFKRVNHLNNYYGHLCWAGYNQIVIDNFGDVYRGWCKSNNSLGNVFRGDVVLDKKPYPCPKQQCKNGFDLQAHKSKGSWGLA